MNTLPIPFISQVLPGALEHQNDCGAAVELMLAQAYRLEPCGDTGLYAAWIRDDLRRLGLACEWKTGLQVSDLFTALTQKKPVGVLVHYEPLVLAGVSEYRGFLGAHFMVLTGMDICCAAFNDPYRADGKMAVEAPLKVFQQAWSQATLDGNAACSALLPAIPLTDLAPIPAAFPKYKASVACNIRSQAAESGSRITGILPAGAVVEVCQADLLNRRSLILRGMGWPAGWVWTDYLKKVS